MTEADKMENYTPDSRGSITHGPSSQQALQPLRKKEKRKAFSVFHRRGPKKNKQQFTKLSESFTAVHQNNSLVPSSDSHLSLNLSSTWHSSDWKQEDGLGSGLRSTYSSNSSLRSAGSDAQELTDDELAEALVNPQKSSSWPPPVEVSN